MAGFLSLVIIGAIVWVLIRATTGMGGRSYGWLASRGTPALGILLQVESYGLAVEGLRSLGIERRNVTIDVEIPGRTPYTVTASIYVPRNLARDVLPGATVELRVDPRNPNSIAVVGPGTGFATSAMGAS